MSAKRLLMLGGAVAALALGVWLSGHGGPEVAAVRAVPPPALAPVQTGPLAGTASCAGRSCHGRLEPASDGILLNEYTTWATQDPHAGAYAVLLTPDAQAMARRLDVGLAHEADRCLACHTSPGAVHMPDHTERRAGVGCEACHGNATGWLNAHTDRNWAASGKRERGMIAVGDVRALARQCAGCHVGGPGERDVNHDLLAAGHPRLTFEFSTYLANLPAHWRAKQRPEVAWWAVGQAVAAEAALELLQHRAATASAPWPELAEYDCFGCHHALADSGRRTGALTWGTWYLALPGALAARALPELTALKRLMAMPRPPRAAVGVQSAAAAQEMRVLAQESVGWPSSAEFARAWMDRLVDYPRPEALVCWDSAEQTYLGLQALNRVAKDARYQSVLDRLVEVRAFRAGSSGPASFRAAAFFKALDDQRGR